jgi:hypothetical protein
MEYLKQMSPQPSNAPFPHHRLIQQEATSTSLQTQHTKHLYYEVPGLA